MLPHKHVQESLDFLLRKLLINHWHRTWPSGKLSFHPVGSWCHHCDIDQLTQHAYPFETHPNTHTMLTCKHSVRILKTKFTGSENNKAISAQSSWSNPYETFLTMTTVTLVNQPTNCINSRSYQLYPHLKSSHLAYTVTFHSHSLYWQIKKNFIFTIFLSPYHQYWCLVCSFMLPN